MYRDIILFERKWSDKVQLKLIGKLAEGVLSSIQVQAQYDGTITVAKSDLSLAGGLNIKVPDVLIVEDRLINKAELATKARHEVERLTQLRRQIQDRLSDPLALKSNSSVLGVSVFVQAEVSIAPALLDIDPNIHEETPLIRLRIVSSIAEFNPKQITLGAAAVFDPGEFSGTLETTLDLTQKDLKEGKGLMRAGLEFALDGLPAFDLNLPKIALSDFSLDVAEFDLKDWEKLWPSLLPLPIPQLPGADKLTVEWKKDASKNKPQLTIIKGALTITETVPDEPLGALTIFYDNSEVLTANVKNLSLCKDGHLTLGVDYVNEDTTIELGEKSISSLPLKVDIDASMLTFKAEKSVGQHLQVKMTHNIEAIRISAHDDPGVFLDLAITVEYSVSADAPTDIHSKVTRLVIVEPYSIELLKATAELVGDAIRFVGGIKLPKGGASSEASTLRKVLDRLLDLVTSALRWMGRQAAEVGKQLAGVAEAVGDLIRGLLEDLAKSETGAFSALSFEVRLNPRRWQIEQILIMPSGNPVDTNYSKTFLGVDLTANAQFRPALIVNFTGENWYGLALIPENTDAELTLGTDLWLSPDSGPARQMGTIPDKGNATPPRLVQLKATALMAAEKRDERALILAAVQAGRLKLFQSVTTTGLEKISVSGNAFSIGRTGPLTDAHVAFEGKPADADLNVIVDVDTDEIKKRALALMPKSSGNGGGVGELTQRIKINDFTHEFIPAKDGGLPDLALKFEVEIILVEGEFAPAATLEVAVSMNDLSARISAGDRISIYASKVRKYQPLGLDVMLAPKPSADAKHWEVFALDLARGAERFELGLEADATVAYRRVSTSGEGLIFTLSEFAASGSGFDLEASVKPDVPVTLGGVDVPFRFTSGSLSIAASKFRGASLAGEGQLPPALIGEANASIAMQLGANSGQVEVLGATARLDKSGDPIRCGNTQFELTISELGFDFVNDGSYHFYFLLTGSAVFRPEGGLFDSGLLKNFKELEIKLDKAPLGGDPRVLMRSLSFLTKIEPPIQTNFFDLFRFDLKGVAFYPASDKFGGDPAMGFSGQVRFVENGDKPTVNIKLHQMYMAGPADDGFLPRVRFDGLTVGLKTGAVDVEATAIAVDDQMPDLYRPDVLPADVRAEGFLAKGRLDISGWASMSAAMGFLQLSRREGPVDPRHAFFMYGQMEKLTEPIDTPVGRIYLREAGFGFGYRYTLAGIAQAETAKSPRELVKILDNVSKYQGSLNQFEAWEPTYDNNDITLALRGMFSIGAHYPQPTYKSENEAEIPNPLLFDIVVALRTDLTFLINMRGWVATNYEDWISKPAGEAWKSNPTMRGYLYFSVPRKEFLARTISEPGGHVGEHPKLPDALVKAIQAVRFSSTLYIRPGLFHMELGWPYELGFDLGKRGDNFWLSVRGGLINRIEDFSLLYGMAFRADGGVQFGGRIGNDNFGASATAVASFSLEAKIIAYLSLQRFNDSMFYGMLRFDMTLSVNVSVWISFKIFRKRIRLSAGFSLHLAVSIGLEAVITPKALGGRAHVAVGVRAFGRTLSVGIGLAFNDGALNVARARVARFQTLGLGADVPPASEDGRRSEQAPRPIPPRSEQVVDGDDRLQNDIGTMPPPPSTADDENEQFKGVNFDKSDFWAMLFPIGSGGDDERYLLQLIPRDGTQSGDQTGLMAPPNTFFAGPGTPKIAHTLLGDDATLALLEPITFTKIPVGKITGGQREIPVNADREIEKDLTLRTLLSTQFLRYEEDKKDPVFTEPRPRHVAWDRIALPETQEGSADVLGQVGHSREHLSGQARREAEIEESRSAIIAAVMDTAETLARTFSGGGTAPEQPLGEIDARDFGLTFLVDAKDLRTLFPVVSAQSATPRVSGVTIRKSDTTEAGQIHLFNPPERMFRNAQPRMSPDHEVTPDGIKLKWDLEPAWGASQNPYDDPEFHLRSYNIRRRITGLPGGEYTANFTCKAAAPTKFDPSDPANLDPNICRMTETPYQFVDDLRRQDATGDSPVRDIPREVRQVILGLRPLASIPDAGNIKVEYEIKPVDIAGTSDRGEPYEVVIRPSIEIPPASPIEANLQLIYDAFPTLADNRVHGVAPSHSIRTAPDFRLMMRRPPKPDVSNPDVAILPQDDAPAKGLTFHLRVIRDRAVPSGGYGSDAVTEGRNRPNQDQIEAFTGANVDDFVIVLGDEIDPRETTDDLVVAFDPAGAQSSDDATQTPEQQESAQLFRATLMAADGTTKVTLEELTKALCADLPRIKDAMITPEPGISARLFVRAIADETNIPGRTAGLKGEWRSVSPNVVVLSAPESGKPPAIDTIVETFERPTALEFRALERRDMGVRSGRLHVFRPTATARLDHVFNAKLPTHGLRLAPDADRRTATRISWNVRADSLALTDRSGSKLTDFGSDSLYRWVSGFSVYQLDPESFVGDGDDPATIAAQSNEIGTVRMLPASERGLSPDRFGDMSRLEFAFPSTAWRDALTDQVIEKTAHAHETQSAPKPVSPAWFSAADSTAIFPRPRVRRLLLPDLDDGLIAELFAEGRPSLVNVHILAWADPKTAPLGEDWRLEQRAGLAGKPLSNGDHHHIRLDPRDNKLGFEVDELRRALLGVVLVPTSENGEKVEEILLKDTAKASSQLQSVKVTVTASRPTMDRSGKILMTAGDLVETGQVEQVIDLMPAMHPILSDTLARLPLAQTEQGTWFRRYSVAPDDTPPSDAETFFDYLDEFPTERDPHGFAALRALGLASGFQLYDTDTGEFLRGDDLFTHLEDVFSKVLALYGMADSTDGDAGLPFVDILTRPWGTGRLFWFDGGQEDSEAEDLTRLREDETLAAVQIALRPAPDRIVQSDRDNAQDVMPVRYASLNLNEVTIKKLVCNLEKMAEKSENQIWLDRLEFRLKVLPDTMALAAAAPPSGIETLPVHQFSDEAMSFAVGYLDTVAEVRIPLRATLTQDVGIDQIESLKFEVVGIAMTFEPGSDGEDGTVSTSEHKLGTIEPIIEVFDPAQIGRLEPGMGQFPELKAETWAQALFRPALDGNAVQLSATRAFDRLAWYTGRRFGAMKVPVGDLLEAEDLTSESTDAVSRRIELAQKLTGFWSSYLKHCAIPAPTEATSPVHFSLGTLADPGSWVQTPDSHGRVSMLIPDANRRGARRSFAVRPLGRFDDWAKACTWQMHATDGAFEASPVQGLAGALATDADLTQFVHTTLPRTEPLEKPVILSARRLPENDGLEGKGWFEVAVAHPSDMVLATANRRNSALLAPQELSVGLWREFAHQHWLTAAQMILAGNPKLNPKTWNPMAPFGFGATALPDRPDDAPVPRDEIEARLTELRNVVPDAWRGTSVFSFSHLPYFFRMHVLVHTAAGIVVSDHASAQFTEGFPLLSLPWEDAGKEVLTGKDTAHFAGYCNRTDTSPPTWRIALDEAGNRVLELTLPLTRIIDAMPKGDAELWFGINGEGYEHIEKFTHLPEPLTSYRIGIETLRATNAGDDRLRTTLARSHEVNIHPLSFDKALKGTAMYVANPSGSQLALPDAATSVSLAPETDEGMIWTLPVHLNLPEFALSKFPISADEATEFAKPDFAVWHHDRGPLAFGYHAKITFDEATKPTDAKDWKEKLDALSQMLIDNDLPDQAAILSATFETYLANTVGFVLALPLPAAIWTQDDVANAVTAFFGKPLEKGAPYLQLRKGLTNDELKLLPFGETRFPDFLTAMTDRLFGERRRLALSALRGTLPPTSGLIRHDKEMSS